MLIIELNWFLFRNWNISFTLIIVHNTLLLGFAQNRFYPGMGVLNERTCIPIEISDSSGLKVMFFLGSTFNIKYFKAPIPTMRAIFSISSSEERSNFPNSRAISQGSIYHFGHQIICIHHGAFATFHLSLGQLNHTIRKCKILAPFKSKLSNKTANT